MELLKISNDFTGRSTIVDPSKPLTRARIRAIRRRLCADSCRSGDDLGGRGSQENPVQYLHFLDRAIRVLMTGKGE